MFIGYIVLHNVAVLSPASLENCSIPEIFGARNRYTYTAVVREIAAVIATGHRPGLRRRVGSRRNRKPHPDHRDARSVLTVRH